MPTFFNHSHYPVSEYRLHSPIQYKNIKEFGGLHSSRALACSSPGDIVQLDPRLRRQYYCLRDHLYRAGLETGEVVFDADLAIIKKYPSYELSVYGFNPTIHKLQPNEDRLKITRACNNKNQFMAWCAEAGLPIPRTYASSHGPVHNLADIRLPAIIKPARSSGGLNIRRVATKEELAACLRQIGDKFEYQVQEELTEAAFFSEQYEANTHGAIHLGTTDLLVNGYEYKGNLYPSSCTGRIVADSAAEKLWRQGLRGPFGFDMAVDSDGEKFIECNARWTGATYPTKIARRLDVRAWTACKLPTHYGQLDDIKIDDLTYSPKARAGLVIINAGQLLTEHDHSLSFLIVGDPKTQTEIRTELEGRLINGAYS